MAASDPDKEFEIGLEVPDEDLEDCCYLFNNGLVYMDYDEDREFVEEHPYTVISILDFRRTLLRVLRNVVE